MNERILTKLALQASDKDGWLDRQKFAELIVRECAKVLEIQGANTGHEQYYYGASLIEEHFGVE